MQNRVVPIQNSGLSVAVKNWFIELLGLQHSAACSTKPHYIKIFIVLLWTKLTLHTSTPGVSREELNSIAEGFLNSNIT